MKGEVKSLPITLCASSWWDIPADKAATARPIIKDARTYAPPGLASRYINCFHHRWSERFNQQNVPATYQTSHLARKSRDRAIIDRNGHKHNPKCKKYIEDTFQQDNISSAICTLDMSSLGLRLSREMWRHMGGGKTYDAGDYIWCRGDCGVFCSKMCLIAS